MPPMAFKRCASTMLVSIFLAGFATGQTPNAQTTSAETTLPKEVKRVIDRAETCNHLAGEIDDDNSEHDKEIDAELRRNNCGAVEKQLQRLAAMYKDQPKVLKAIKAAQSQE